MLMLTWLLRFWGWRVASFYTPPSRDQIVREEGLLCRLFCGNSTSRPLRITSRHLRQKSLHSSKKAPTRSACPTTPQAFTFSLDYRSLFLLPNACMGLFFSPQESDWKCHSLGKLSNFVWNWRLFINVKKKASLKMAWILFF